MKDDERRKAFDHIREERNINICLGNLKEGAYFEDLGADGKIIIMLVFHKYFRRIFTMFNLAQDRTVVRLFWTRWWIFGFHELSGLHWLAEDIALSAEGLYCMECRRIPFLKILSLSFGLFTEASQFYSQQGQKSFTKQFEDQLWGSHSFLSSLIGG